jgi:hypothetical protein
LFADLQFVRRLHPAANAFAGSAVSPLSLSLSLILFPLLSLASLSFVLASYTYPSSKGPLSSRTPRLMSIPLGTFNSEERVQISTAIRLARQLPPGNPPFLSLVLSFYFPFAAVPLSFSHAHAPLLFLPFWATCLRNEYARLIFAPNILSRSRSSWRRALASLMDIERANW